MSKVLSLLPLLLILICCQKNPLKVDVSGINLNLSMKRLDHDLFKVTPDNLTTKIPELKQKYGSFFDAYNQNVLALGDPTDPMYSGYLYTCLSDSVRLSSRQKIDSVFNNLTSIQKPLEEGFRHYRYYFPDKKIPEVITIISGFNQSVVMTTDAIGISLDNYLGADCPFYRNLALPAYKRENMCAAKIPTDVLYAWGVSEFLYNEANDNMLSQMVYQGKMIYFLDAMFPDEPDHLKIGYQPEKLEWCKKNESAMWTYLVEHKLLFSSERMNIVRLINPAPFTSIFSPDSPGRAGIWIGWQIVRSYMKKNPGTTLPELMANNDYQRILNESGYSPEE